MSTPDKHKDRLGDFKFNTVGREDAAAEVLRPQVDPATKTRNLVFAVVAAVVLAGILYLSFQKTGKDIFAAPANDKKFDRPEIQID